MWTFIIGALMFAIFIVGLALIKKINIYRYIICELQSQFDAAMKVNNNLIEINDDLVRVNDGIIIFNHELITSKEKMMATLNEMLAKENETKKEETPTKKHWREDKEHKWEKLQRLTKEFRTVAFLAKTPGSSEGIPAQAIMLRDAEVKRTADKNYVVTGRDLEEEERVQLEADHERLPYGQRPDNEKQIRSYRIDRIFGGTIMCTNALIRG